MTTVESLVFELESGDNVIAIPNAHRFTMKTLSSQDLNITLGGGQEFPLASGEIFDTGYSEQLMSTTCNVSVTDAGNLLVLVIC